MSIREIIFNRLTKFSTCCLSLILYPDDARDLFLSILNALSRPSSAASHDLLRSSGNFSFFLFFFVDPGGKSRRFSQAVRDGRSRGAVSRLLLVWPTAVRFPSFSETQSTFVPQEKRQRVEKMTDFIFSGYVRQVYTLAVLVVYLRNAMNTGDVSSRLRDNR